MTIHETRQYQRLRSEEDRQALEAIALARRAALEREEARARGALLRWTLVFVALSSIGLVALAMWLRGAW